MITVDVEPIYPSITLPSELNMTVTFDVYCKKDIEALIKLANALNNPVVDWSKVPVDTPIIVTNVYGGRRYFAGLVEGRVAYFPDGSTSWSSKRNKLIYADLENVELALDSDKEKYTKVVIPNDLYN